LLRIVYAGNPELMPLRSDYLHSCNLKIINILSFMKREKKSSQTTVPNQKINTLSSNGYKANLANSKNEIPLQKKIIGVAILLVVTFIGYSNVFQNELTNWDDNQYVVENNTIKEINSKNLKQIFAEYKMGNYHPLSMLSLAIDYQMTPKKKSETNINPFFFHLTPILLHILTTILVFFLLIQLFNNYYIAFFAALLFGVHTIHVESVVWISERKDVLYSAFYIISLIFYVKYVDTKKSLHWIFSFLFFILSLLSKAQAVSLAVTLLAVDYLRNRNFKEIHLWLEKIPYFILALIFGIVAIKAQQEGNAIISTDSESYSFIQRIGFAGYAFSTYLFEMILPINLSAINPYPDIINKTMPAYYWLGLIPSLAVIFILFMIFKKSKEFTFALAFFIINIFLLLQLIPVGSAIHADRYAYIPSIGFFTFVGIGINRVAAKNKNLQKPLFAILIVYAIVLIFLTLERNKVWKNSLTLWNDTVEKSPKAVVAWNNRGSIFDKQATDAFEQKDYKNAQNLRYAAISDFTQAVEQKPDYSSAFYNRGRTKLDLGKQMKDTNIINSAISDYSHALQFDPRFADAYLNRGLAKDELNLTEEALKDFNSAIEIDPNNSTYYSNRGVAKGKMQQYQAAIEDFNKALSIKPNDESSLSNRGFAHTFLKQYDLAMQDYNRSIEIKPNAKTYFNRCILKKQINDIEGALKDADSVILLDDSFIDAYLQKGYCFLLMNQREKACLEFSNAAQKGSKTAEQLIAINCKK